ncbi:MAG: hypothetical protein JWO40_273 [Candidatus Doudnabacteria bacterium]|nr:hypothetical protein [Candidatus Doudnabacteria bacterium]
MQLTPAQKSRSGVGLFLICIILAVVLTFFLVWPKYGQYKDSLAAKDNNQQSLDLIKSQQAQVTTLYSKLQASSADLKKIDVAIPTGVDIPAVYAYLESMAQSLNLGSITLQGKDENEVLDQGNVVGVSGAPVSGGPTSIGTGAPKSNLPASLGAIDLTMTVTGSYQNFVTFLGKIQNSLRLIDVQSIDVTSSEGKPDLSFSIAMKTYYQK